MSDHLSDNVLEVLNKKIRTIMNETADHVSGGGCRTFEEYSKCCGIIEGLAIAERELLDLNKHIENN